MLFRLAVPHIAGGRTAPEPELLRAQGAERLAHAPSLLGYAYQLYAGIGSPACRGCTDFGNRHWVTGAHDRVIPLVNARLLARRIPGAQLCVVRGGGHLFLLDEPEQAIPPIRAFLEAA